MATEEMGRPQRLESWKAIAAYLNRSERTVRRWEALEGLPVHRLQHDSRGSVFAYAAELDAWRESRQQKPDLPAEPALAGRAWAGSPRWLAAGSVLVAGSLVAAFALNVRPVTRTPHPDAVRALQQGRFAANAGRVQIATGLKYFREAVRLDPEYAAARSAVAVALVASTWFDEVRAPDTLAQAKQEADRAARLDPSSARPSMVFGWYSHYIEWDHRAAEQHFRRAADRAPTSAVTLSWLGDFLLNMRRFDEALHFYKRAQEADPRWLEPITFAAHVHGLTGNYDLAAAEHRRALEVEPNYGLGLHFAGRTALGRGDAGEAIRLLRKSNDVLGAVPFSLADLGHALAVAKHREEAESILADMRRRREKGYYPAFALAVVELGLGRKDAALDWLEQAADERHLGFYMPSVDPAYDSVRSDPRFKRLMGRTGLPQ